MKRRLPDSASQPSVNLWDNVPRNFPRAISTNSNIPINDYQALMEAAPGDEPRETAESLAELRDLLVAVIEMLPPLEQRIIEALFIEQLSLRECAARFARSKTTIARIRDDALATMQDLLTDNETVNERINR